MESIPTTSYDRPAELNELIPKDYFGELVVSDYFNDEAPLEVDLGCGDGTFLLKMAEHHHGIEKPARA